MSALGQKQISLPGRPVWEDYWKTKMEEEIDISGTDDDGHTIHGSYRVAAGVVHVTLSDGTSSTTQLGNTPAPALAKIILQELARKSRGVS
jgi:hypothetical protein